MLRIPLPTLSPNTEIEYTLEFQAASVNGNGTGARTVRRRTGEARRESLRRLAGSIDDPTFVRPAQGEYEKRESME